MKHVPGLVLANLRSAKTVLLRHLSHLKSSEVAEALVAAWCMEYLKARRLGGFNIYQIMTISVLMLIVKSIIEHKKDANEDENSVIVSDRITPMDPMGRVHDPTDFT